MIPCQLPDLLAPLKTLEEMEVIQLTWISHLLLQWSGLRKISVAAQSSWMGGSFIEV
jgi:hypothetical protein